MFMVLSTEYLKFRRSKMLLLAVIANFLPPIVKYLQYIFSKSKGPAGAELYLTSGQELMVLSMLTTVVLVSGFVFTMEYQYNTASYIFTSGTSKASIFTAKLIFLLTVIALLFSVSALSEVLFSCLATGDGVSWSLFLKLLKVTGWYVFSYFLLSIIVVMISVFTKKFVVSAVIALGYIIMIFTFHLKNNVYICPFMTPSIVAAKIYGSSNYILTNYYKDIAVNYYGITIFLVILAAISMIIGINCYRKQDAVK